MLPSSITSVRLFLPSERVLRYSGVRVTVPSFIDMLLDFEISESIPLLRTDAVLETEFVFMDILSLLFLLHVNTDLSAVSPDEEPDLFLRSVTFIVTGRFPSSNSNTSLFSPLSSFWR